MNQNNELPSDNEPSIDELPLDNKSIDNKLSLDEPSDELPSDELSFDDAFNALLIETREVELMTNVVIPEPAKIEPTMVLVEEFDAKYNILVHVIREEFKREIVFDNCDLFTNPQPTTLTIDGFLTNVRMHENELINVLEPTPTIVVLDCNFGTKIYPGYTPPVKVKNTNRGRKRIIKPKSTRKVQGSGRCFNSQLTFETLRSVVSKTGATTYKFKLFRNGRLQLPGAKPEIVEDIIEKAYLIVDVMNHSLHDGELDIGKKTNISNMNTVMKNYKFYTLLAKNQLIDLGALKKILLQHKILEQPDSPPRPPIIDVKYTGEDTNVSVIFSTPTAKKPSKYVRVNIYMSGKINILGSYYDLVTKQMCEYLYYIFKKHPEIIITKAEPPIPFSLIEVVEIQPVVLREFTENEHALVADFMNGL